MGSMKVKSSLICDFFFKFLIYDSTFLRIIEIDNDNKRKVRYKRVKEQNRKHLKVDFIST